MTETPSTEYVVGVGPLSGEIYVGRLTKDGKSFAEKQERTDMVLAIVGEYVQRNFQGSMEVTFPALDFAVRVQVISPIWGDKSEEGQAR